MQAHARLRGRGRSGKGPLGQPPAPSAQVASSLEARTVFLLELTCLARSTDAFQQGPSTHRIRHTGYVHPRRLLSGPHFDPSNRSLTRASVAPGQHSAGGIPAFSLLGGLQPPARPRVPARDVNSHRAKERNAPSFPFRVCFPWRPGRQRGREGFSPHEPLNFRNWNHQGRASPAQSKANPTWSAKRLSLDF